MKKSILCFILILGFVTNAAMAQETTDKETPEAFSKKLAKAIIANDEALLTSYFQTYQDFKEVIKSRGRSLSDDVDPKMMEQSMEMLLQMYQSQLKSLRKESKNQDFNWDKTIIDSVKAEKIEKIKINKGAHKTALYPYEIEINLTSITKQMIINLKIIETLNGFRVGEISDWEINE